jgi:DNA-binding CsgD family transcriptional regulator
MRWRILAYGAALAAGTALLSWLDMQSVTRMHARDLWLGLIATGFLALGVFLGARLFAPAPPHPPDGNRLARDALGISARELEVLRALGAGMSNKEIARALSVSPNTVKTHLANLFAKLGAKRRTQALARARALGLMGEGG